MRPIAEQINDIPPTSLRVFADALHQILKRAPHRLGDNLLSVTLYGSRARGEAREGSDFDLIVTVQRCSSEEREAVHLVDVEMMNEFDELFVGMIYDEASWKKTEKFPFGWNVAREGLSL